MTVDIALIIVTAYFVAAFVKGATGLGFSTSALPILALGLGLKAAMPLVIVPSLVSNLIVMSQAGHFRETLIRFWPLFVATVPGLILGLMWLDRIDGLMAGAALGVVLIGYAGLTLLRPDRGISLPAARRLAPAIGFCTGFVNGVTGSQVMPVLPFLLSLKLDPPRFIQAINVSFTLSSLIMAVGLTGLGLMTWHAVAISVAGLIPVYLGTRLGSAVRRRLSAEAFRRVVLVMLMMFGIVLLAKAAGG